MSIKHAAAGTPRAKPRFKAMSLDRFRRQVFTVAMWARKHHHVVVEEWADTAVDFIGEQMLEMAARVARLRAEKASAEADRAALRAQLEIAQHTIATYADRAAVNGHLAEADEL